MSKNTKELKPRAGELILRAEMGLHGLAIGQASILEDAPIDTAQKEIPPENRAKELKKYDDAIAYLQRQYQVARTESENLLIEISDETKALISAENGTLNGLEWIIKENLESRIEKGQNIEFALNKELESIINGFENTITREKAKLLPPTSPEKKKNWKKPEGDDADTIENCIKLARKNLTVYDEISKVLLLLVAHPNNPPRTIDTIEAGSIIVTKSLSPIDIVHFPDENGFSRYPAMINWAGTETSHTSVLAKALGTIVARLPEETAIRNGQTIIVDGEKNIVIIAPDRKRMAEYEKKILIQKAAHKT